MDMLRLMFNEYEEERQIFPVALAATAAPGLISYRAPISHGIFIDPRQEAITKRKWSTDAPAWRIATKGLNLEGNCTNFSCKAYNGSRVIHKWGKRNFDFFAQEHLCKCPICNKYVQPITCGFYDTQWKISGYKKESGSAPVKVKGQWNTASSDGYTTFDDDLTTVIDWKELKIEVR